MAGRVQGIEYFLGQEYFVYYMHHSVAGFVVRAGAVARLEIVPSAVETVSPMRKKLIESGVLVEEDEQYCFSQDYLFNTPSGAAAVVLGRTSNGWVDWKDKDGKTLHEAKRAESEEQHQD